MGPTTVEDGLDQHVMNTELVDVDAPNIVAAEVFFATGEDVMAPREGGTTQNDHS